LTFFYYFPSLTIYLFLTQVNEVKAVSDIPGYEPVSSTLWRQREEYCARLIQHAWRRHKSGIGLEPGTTPSAVGDASKEKIETVEEEPEELLVITTGSPSSPSEKVPSAPQI
jgi:hypothetical protein